PPAPNHRASLTPYTGELTLAQGPRKWGCAMRACAWLVGAAALLTIACGVSGQPTPAAGPPTASPPQAQAVEPPGRSSGQDAPPAVPKPGEAPSTASGPRSAVHPLTPPAKVRYGTLQLAAEAATYIAVDKGYFSAEGLDLEFTPFRSGSEMTVPLATGALDI